MCGKEVFKGPWPREADEFPSVPANSPRACSIHFAELGRVINLWSDGTGEYNICTISPPSSFLLPSHLLSLADLLGILTSLMQCISVLRPFSAPDFQESGFAAGTFKNYTTIC